MRRALPQPNLGLAIVLCLVVVGLQIMLSMPLAVVDALAERSGGKPPHLAQHPLSLALINLAAFAGAIVIGLLLNKLRPTQAFRWVSVPLTAWAGTILASLGCIILASEIDNVFRWVLPPPKWVTALMETVFWQEGRFFSRLLLMVLVAPLTEELLFRGLILRGLLWRFRPFWAVLLSATLFAAVHLNPWQFSSALLLGFAVGWFFLRTGSIAVCILAHALVNGCVFALAELPIDVPGLTFTDPNAPVQFQPVWLDVLGLAVLGSGLWLFARQTRPYEPDFVPPVIPIDSDPPPTPPAIGNAGT